MWCRHGARESLREQGVEDGHVHGTSYSWKSSNTWIRDGMAIGMMGASCVAMHGHAKVGENEF